MKINKKIYWFLVPLFFAGGLFYYRNSYTEFTPMLFINDSYSTLKMDSALNRNLVNVLYFHNEPYKKDPSGRVLVRRSLNNDKELVYNYTKKALDSAWLNSHIE